MSREDVEVGTASLLERDQELERLDVALPSALDSTGSLVLIHGSAGIGKTALVMACQRRARAAGLAVATARGSELERELAFGVVRQLLEPFVFGAEPSERSELFSGAAALAKPLFAPAASSGAEVGSAADGTFSVLHGLDWLCANLGQARPLLLAVDDAHWADIASLRFLAYLGQRLEGLPLAVVVAARPAETPVDEELLGRLERDPRAVTITPPPLSDQAVATVIADELHEAPDPEFTEACRRATGGVPLLVRELATELAESGVEPVAASAPLVEEVGPPTVARYVVARVRRLTPAAETVARAIAVLGADADLARVVRLAEVGDEAGLAAVDALAAAGVISPARPLEFAHPVLRAAVYGELLPGELSAMHARAAALLQREGADEERIASHLLIAAPSGDHRVVALLLRTARAAFARGAPGSAVAYLERALAEPPNPGTRIEVLRELGAAEVHSGLPDRASDHLREAYRLADRGRGRALIAQALAGALRLRWQHAEASEVIAATLREDIEDEDLALALRAELLLIETLEPATGDADVSVGDAVEMPPGRTIGAAKYLAALTTDAVLRSRRPAAEARELAAAAREAGIVEDLAHGGSLWINAIGPLVIADGFSMAESMLAEAFDASRRHASVIFTTRAYVARSFLRLRQGALREAQADAETALATGRDAGFYFTLLSLSVLVEVHCERGDLEAAADELARSGMDGDVPDTFVHNWVLASRGTLRAAEGRPEAAVADFEELGRRNELRGQDNPAGHARRARLAMTLLRTGDTAQANSLAEEEVALARSWGAPRALGISLRVLGLCEGGDGGLARLRQSAAVLDGSGAELEYARSLVELGAAIRRSGSRSEAREPLRDGMEIAHRCGAPPLTDQAREELLATGARPRRILRTGIEALTPSELRVARMAAEGLTNREIAQALFVTPRTVEGHLTHAFQKLEIGSRAELEKRLAAAA